MIDSLFDRLRVSAASARSTVLLAVGSVVLALVLCSPHDARAQRAPGEVGIGGQVGNPSGLSLKIYQRGFPSYDILAAWDLDNFFFLNAHMLQERHLGNNERVHFFFGPGAFLGIDDRPADEDDDVVVGISGQFGLSVIVERFEIYARVTPRLSLVPGTDGDVGGGLGLRYYF